MLDEPFRKDGDNYGNQEKDGEAQASEEARDEEKGRCEEAQIVSNSYLCQEDIPRTHVVGGFRLPLHHRSCESLAIQNILQVLDVRPFRNHNAHLPGLCLFRCDRIKRRVRPWRPLRADDLPELFP